ncbi:MAG: oligosaccharide flippase family protein [Putridiphycobacter sp.]|nr:oligosaccharide flippase family protein [Putridiphycobacter sp.]
MHKFSTRNKLAFSIGAYTAVNVINKGIPFLLIPILTHYLSPADMGVLTNIESLFVIVIALVGMNISTAVTRQYVKKEVSLNSYIFTAFRVMLVSFAILTLLFSVFANYISEFTAIPINIIYFISVYALLDNVVEVLLALWRMKDKPFYYGLFRILRTIIELSISLVLVIGYKYDWFGRFLGIYISGIILSIIAISILAKNGIFNGKFSAKYRRHFLHFGVPLIPHTISGVLILYSDKLIITKMIGIEENGLYSVAFTIGMAISLLQNSFNQAWVPWLFKKLALNNKTEDKKLVRITYLYVLVMFGFVLLLWLLTPIIYMFIDEDFASGMEVVVIIGLGFAFNGMYKMMVNYLFYAEKTNIISIITICLAAFNIALSIYLIPNYGILGPAYASAFTFFLQFIITWYISNKYHPMPWFK